MSRNDIRLRRQRLAGGGSHRFRNYGAVLERHEKDMRIKKIIKVFTYFAIILIVVMLLIIVTRTGERLEKESGGHNSSTMHFNSSGPRPMKCHPGYSSALRRTSPLDDIS